LPPPVVQFMLNGFGEAAEVEAQRAEMIRRYSVEVLYNGADLAKPEDCERLVRDTEKRLGAWTSWSTMRGSAHLAHRGLPYRTLAGGDRRKPFVRLLYDAGGAALHEGVQLGTAHQYFLGPWPDRFDQQVRLYSRQARHLGSNQGGCAGKRKNQRDLQRHLPGWVLTELVKKQIALRAQTQGISYEQAQQNLIATEPTGRFSTPEEMGALGRFPVRRACRQYYRRKFLLRRRLHGTIDPVREYASTCRPQAGGIRKIARCTRRK